MKMAIESLLRSLGFVFTAKEVCGCVTQLCSHKNIDNILNWIEVCEWLDCEWLALIPPLLPHCRIRYQKKSGKPHKDAYSGHNHSKCQQ